MKIPDDYLVKSEQEYLANCELWLLNIPANINQSEIDISRDSLLRFLIAAVSGNNFTNNMGHQIHFNAYIVWLEKDNDAGYIRSDFGKGRWSLPEGQKFTVSLIDS